MKPRSSLDRALRRALHPILQRYDDLLVRLANLESALDYMLVEPFWVDEEHVGFNGQRGRKALFDDLTSVVKLATIVETGTWVGNTTGYMATRTGLPLATCELTPRFKALAERRLEGIGHISFSLSDSRSFLSSLEIAPGVTFFYLDAHWYDDLPLAEELNIIARRWNDYVIMIDDFAVPGDPGYGYDDYGANKRLTWDVFGSLVERLNMSSFFPTLPSREETGAKRGCIILASPGAVAETMVAVRSLHSA